MTRAALLALTVLALCAVPAQAVGYTAGGSPESRASAGTRIAE